MPAADDRRTARLVGWLFIGTFVFSIPGLLLYGPVLDHADYVLSDGHDTQLSVIPDLASGLVWPGAMTRSRRNRFIERWAGREWALRQARAEAYAGLQEARKNGDVDEGPLSMGQDAGLVRDIPPAGEIVTRIAQEAEQILTSQLPRVLVSA